MQQTQMSWSKMVGGKVVDVFPEVDYLVLHIHKRIAIVALLSQGSHIPFSTAGSASLC